jgi:integrase
MAEPRRRPLPSDSVAAICDAYLEWAEQHRSPDTYRWYKDRLQAFIGSIPSTLRVGHLRPYHVQRFVDAMSVASGTKRNYVRAVKRAMIWAEEQGYVARSPIAHLKKPRQGKRENIVTDADFTGILGHTRDTEFRDLCTFAWHTGARAAECFAVEARHVELGEGRIVFPVDEEKMERAPRIIYLNGEALAIVKRLLGEHPEGHLFRNTDGLPWTPDATNCRFKTLEKKIGKKVCLTDFRHTFCHRLLKTGVDALTVATLMGHADPSMVAKVYSHLNHAADYLREQVRRAGKNGHVTPADASAAPAAPVAAPAEPQ